jgi:peptidyl-prolyl cis-trans isomerase SurA
MSTPCSSGYSASRFKEALSQHGLTEEQLRLQLQWQLDVLRFIDQRFRPGVLVTDEEVRAYYEPHQADLKRQLPQAKTYEAMEPKIRESLEGERLNQNFDQWLVNARKRNRIDYRQGAFQ